MAFVFGLQTLYSKDFINIYQLKGLKPKNKGHMNFYEYCDLTKKSIFHVTYILGRWYLCIAMCNHFDTKTFWNMSN